MPLHISRASSLRMDTELDREVSNSISNASASFRRLHTRVWNSHNITISTKIAVYQAVVINTLLYGSESWTTYARHIKKLEFFHQRCLRKILHVTWQYGVTNLYILSTSGCPSMESMVKKRQLRWAGHLVRMDDDRLPKQVLYGELVGGQRKIGRPRKRS